MAGGYVTIQVVVREAVGGATGSEIFYCAMQGVVWERAVDAFSFELLRAYFGAEVDGSQDIG